MRSISSGFGCIETVRRDIGTARTQFEEGLALLRQTFPGTDFDIGEMQHPQGETKAPGVTAFRDLLAGMPSGMPSGHAVRPCRVAGHYHVG